MKLIAYHNNPELKEKFIKEIKWHMERDAIIKGRYGKGSGDNFKGCVVGCSINSLNKICNTKNQTSNHQAYESLIGVPAALAHLEDSIFEDLPEDKAKQWPLRFAEAIQPGADLSMVIPELMVWLMEDLEKHTKPRSDQRKALQLVANLYKRRIAGREVTDDEFAMAAAWATRAAEAAAWAAEAAEATRAAAEAAEAAEATRAAWATRAAAEAAMADEVAAYEKMADKLVELMKGAPVEKEPHHE